MRSCLPLASFAILAAGLAGQTPASYRLFGTGCNSAPTSNCITFNDQSIALTVGSLPNEYAYPVVNSTGLPIQVIGFEVFTVTNTAPSATGNSGILRDNSGAGALVHTQPAPTTVANGKITVTNVQGWYSTNVYPPVTVAAGEAFWLELDAYSAIAPPQNSLGAVGIVSNWYRRPLNAVPNWTVSVSVSKQVYRVHCLPVSPTVPSLVNTGTPVIGQSFTLNIAGAVPFTAAFLISAFNNTTWASLPLPLDLAIFGAPNCFNYTSADSSVVYVLDPQGSVSVPWSIPNNAGLSGFPFFNQAATFATGANPLGLLTTNGGAGVVGM